MIDPSNLWLTIHESIGHATEYDRAIGYEAAYAGTSFATPDKLGTMRYGSPVMNVTADRTVEFGLATVGFDDEGVRAQSWDLVRDGIFVGYQWIGCSPHGWVFRAQRLLLCRFAASCADSADGQRVPAARSRRAQHRRPDRAGRERHPHRRRQIVINRHAALQLSVHRAAVLPDLRDGRLDGQLRDVAYQATTTDFWGSLEAVGGPSTWRLGGAFNCGKAQPGQVAAVSHGCPSALFRGGQRAQHADRGGTVTVIGAQQVVDIALAAAARRGKADETMVLVTDPRRRVRCAGRHSMTTNGESASRSTTVISLSARVIAPASAR